MMIRPLAIALALICVLINGCSDDTNEDARRDQGVALDQSADPLGDAARESGSSDSGVTPATIFSSEEQKKVGARFKKKMEALGYLVQEGAMTFFHVKDCKGLTSCYGNNPTSPYGMLALPPAPGETVPQADLPALGHPTKSVIWRLREDEAIVIFGPTPPPARYFSYVSYMFQRWDATQMKNKDVFASLGDALNPVTLKLGAKPSTNEQGAHAAVITTADKNADKAIRQALKASGVADSLVNTDDLPHPLLKMGHDSKADSFMMLHRIALFENEANGAAYLNAPPMSVWRLTPKAQQKIDPMPLVPFSSRGSGTNESTLKAALNLLEAAIRKAHTGASLVTLKETEVDLSGHTCIKNDKNCLGDINDAAYSKTLNLFLLKNDPADFFVVFGVNHEATGKAIYSNVGVIKLSTLMGVDAIASDKMKGSADVYLPTHPKRDQLYAYKIARDCGTETFCLEIPVAFPGLPLNEPPTFQYRAYLEPGKPCAPAFSELLPARIIKFSSK